MHTGIFLDRRLDALLVVGMQTAYMHAHDWHGRTIAGGGAPVGNAHDILPQVQCMIDRFRPKSRWASITSYPPYHASFAISYSHAMPGDAQSAEGVRRWTQRRIRMADRFTVRHLLQYLDGIPGRSQVLQHCHAVEGSEEAELHPAFRDLGFRLVHLVGYDQVCNVSSAFNDALGRPTGLGVQMREAGVQRVFIVGVDHNGGAVMRSAVEAARSGFGSHVVFDATYFSQEPEGVSEACDEAQRQGVKLLHSSDFLDSPQAETQS